MNDLLCTTSSVMASVQMHVVWLLVVLVGLGSAEVSHAQQTRHSSTSETYRTRVSNTQNAKSVASRLRDRSVTYVNALAKKVQAVQAHVSPDGKDLVTPITYDAAGRSTTAYLPFVSENSDGRYVGNATTKQGDFYSDDASLVGFPATTMAYSRKVIDASPLERVVETGAVGETWQPGGRSVTTSYNTNAALEVARLLVGSDDSTLVQEGHYGAGTLSKRTVTDENGDTVVAYTDRDDREVMKIAYDGGASVTTRYIYDKRGNLRWVLPPNGVQEWGGTSSNLADAANKWGTYHKYDNKDRPIERYTQEADVVTMVYDQFGRVILRQDGLLRQNNDWLFTKHDRYGRTVMTGLYHETDATRAKSRHAMQAYVNSLSVSDPSYESPSNASGALFGYTNEAFPKEDTSTPIKELFVWTVTDYDDYDFNRDGAADAAFEPVGQFSNTDTEVTTVEGSLPVDGHMAYDRVTGKTTRTRVRVLDPKRVYGGGTYETGPPSSAEPIYYKGEVRLKPGFRTKPGQDLQIGPNVSVPSDADTPRWITSISFYDRKGRTIQLQREGLVSTDVTSTQYTFDGKTRKIARDHRRLDGKMVANGQWHFLLQTTFDYDVAGRVKRVYQQNDGDAEVVVAEYTYNAVGERIESDLHKPSGATSYAQNVTTERNVRGWMTRKTATAEGSTLFDLELGYDAIRHGSTARYDGSISWTQQTLPDAHQGSFAYLNQYDGLGRLTEARYRQWASNGDVNLAAMGRYDLTSSYDLNGNLTSLTRNGANGYIDQLNYHYQGAGNQLTNVTDASGSAEGFTQNGHGASTNLAYTYDSNGNLLKDRHKGLVLDYNALNLPREMDWEDGRRIAWLWTATGTKLRRTVYNTSGVVETKEYASGFTYRYDHAEGRTLDYLSMPAGRVKYIANTDALVYQYAHTDQIGTTRVLYEPATQNVKQFTSTYAYGLRISSLSSTGSSNEDLYHGKELTDAHGLNWYHYGARFYDVARAQWTTTDPADEFHSPYSYVGGDPANLTDPDGRASCDITLCGDNGSSVTVKTDLVEMEADVPIDFGGNYELEGEEIVLAALDLAGTFDPTPVSDALAGSIYLKNGAYGDALLSGIGFIPFIGDVGKLARVERHIGAIYSAINASRKRGGRYREVRDINTGGEVHHMPANSVSPLKPNHGPAIWMERLDHYQTASWGSSIEAQQYRALQDELIKQGRFDDAVQMDIDDLKDKFGDKYDDAILQMIDSMR